MAGAFPDEGLDLARMRRERAAKLRAEMGKAELHALLLLGTAAVTYATGAELGTLDAGLGTHLRTAALLLADDPFPHLFAPDPQVAPPELPSDHLHAPVDTETDEGVEDLARRVLELADGRLKGRLGVDEPSPSVWFGLAQRTGTTLLDAGHVLGAAKLIKTPDELECIRRAQRLNELAMYRVQELLAPGVRQCELTAAFYEEVLALGATGIALDPIFQPMPKRKRDGPFSVNGEVAFPLVTTDRILRYGDVVWVDTGVHYHGYASDFGRTWVVGTSPSPRHLAQFRRWKAALDAVLAAVRPGATGAELTKAAEHAAGERCWLEHFYLAHGVGTESAEMPLVGSDLGGEFDAGLVLAPGMVLVLEPAIWDDGEAGYRAEEIVAVTEEGFVSLSDYPYDPYG